MADFTIDETVDITDVVCPMTFVKAKVAMEELEIGQVLSVHMNDGEPVQNVPRSIKEEGHKILKLLQNEDGTYDLIVKKVGRGTGTGGLLFRQLHSLQAAFAGSGGTGRSIRRCSESGKDQHQL